MIAHIDFSQGLQNAGTTSSRSCRSSSGSADTRDSWPRAPLLSRPVLAHPRPAGLYTWDGPSFRVKDPRAAVTELRRDPALQLRCPYAASHRQHSA